MKILVIGSSDHRRAHCVDWQAPFPNIEEFDLIIINLQSLSQEILDKAWPNIHGEMAKGVRTLFDTGREVFCIINRYLMPTSAGSGAGYVPLPPTNYSWLPAFVTVSEEKPGTSINIIDKRFEKYFRAVEQWTFVLDLYKEPSFLTAIGLAASQIFAELGGEPVKVENYMLSPVAENKSRKMIAGTLVAKSSKLKGSIHLIPPPTKCSVQEGIEMILDIVGGQPPKIVPSWRDEIEVPGIKELTCQIDEQIKNISKSQKKIALLQSKIQELDVYRDLISSSGDDLVKAVQITLSDLGIQTKITGKDCPVDLISDQVAVEVTGTKGAITAASEKISQIARFKESSKRNEKVMLIANTHADLKISERNGKTDFTPQVTMYFKAADVCCMASRTLFELWKEVKSMKRKAHDITKKMLSSNGILTVKDF
jgi:hypothetical protein